MSTSFGLGEQNYFVDSAGTAGGLQLFLDAQQDDYVVVPDMAAGFKVGHQIF